MKALVYSLILASLVSGRALSVIGLLSAIGSIVVSTNLPRMKGDDG